MNDHVDSIEEPSAAEMATIHALLARPDVWHEPPIDLEDRVVTGISTLATVATDSFAPASIVDHEARRRSRSIPWWVATAAACVAIVAGVAALSGMFGDDKQVAAAEVALTGTDAAPQASATAEMSATPAGLKIVLDVDGLPPAPEGHFYEAWISSATLRVSAGSFHLRGGDKPIELWAGVVDPGFTRLAITLEPLDADTDSSGNVQLTGTYTLDDD